MVSSFQRNPFLRASEEVTMAENERPVEQAHAILFPKRPNWMPEPTGSLTLCYAERRESPKSWTTHRSFPAAWIPSMIGCPREDHGRYAWTELDQSEWYSAEASFRLRLNEA